jgi:hypothetical protein
MSTPDRPTIDRQDLDAALAARRELGEEMEPAVLDSFLAKVEGGLDARIDARLATRRGRPGAFRRPDWSAFALAVVSIVIGARIVEEASLGGELIAWLAIIAVNLAYNLRR